MCPPPITRTWPCCGLLCARTITSDETALQRDLHSHSQSSSPTRLRGSSDMNSEWKVVSWTSAPCSVRCGISGMGSVHHMARWWIGRSDMRSNSATAVTPEIHRTRWRVGLTRARAHRNLNVPESTILYQATIVLRTRVSVDAVETPGPRRGSRSVPRGRREPRAAHGEGRFTAPHVASHVSCRRAARLESARAY
jgi:hypothetical protein